MSAELFAYEVDALLELLDRRLRELDRQHARRVVRTAHVTHLARQHGVECSCAVREDEQAD